MQTPACLPIAASAPTAQDRAGAVEAGSLPCSTPAACVKPAAAGSHRPAGHGPDRGRAAACTGLVASAHQEIDFSTQIPSLDGNPPAPPPDAGRRHTLGLGLGLGLAAVLGTGAPQAAAAQATVLRVASFPDLDRGVRVALQAFQQRHPGVQVRLTSLGVTDHHTAMTTALATGANVPDLMAIDVDYIGRLSRSAGLHDLSAPPFGAAAFEGRLAPYAMAAAQPAPGRQTALPVDVGPGTLFYRADLLAGAGLGEEALTESWPGFIEAGRQLRQTTGAYLVAHAADLARIGMRMGLAPGDGVFFDPDGRSLVRSARFERAFVLARAAREAGIDARVRVWTNEWTEGLRSGRIAAQMMGAWLGGHLKNWIAPEASGLWRAAQLPEGAYSAWGGSYYAIPRLARQPALAWAFLQLLALDKAQQLAAFASLDAFPALLAAQAHTVMDEPLDFLGGQPARQLWRVASDRIVPMASDRHDPVAGRVVESELMRVLDQDKPVTQALADAHRTLERRVRRG